MKPDLIALLSLLAVTRTDNADVGIAQGLAALKQLQTDAAQSATDLAAAQAEVATLTTDRDQWKGKHDALQARVDTQEAAALKVADAAERKRLDGMAQRLKVPTEGHADLAAYRRAVALKHLPDLREDASDVYIGAVLDMMEKAAPTRRTPAPRPAPAQSPWNQPGPAPAREDAQDSPPPGMAWLNGLNRPRTGGGEA